VGTGDILRYAGSLLVTNSAYTVYGAIDTLLIGAILTTSAVGLFSGPMRLVLFFGYVGESVAGALAPRVARTAEHEPDVAAWGAGLRWLLIFQSLLVAPLLVWATPIMVLLLGSAFHDSGPILRVLTLYVFLGGLSPVMSVSVNYLGQGARRIPIVLVALLVNAALDAVLLPLVGPLGAAIGTGVAYAIYVPAHFRLCRQAFEIPLRPLARTVARAGLAAAAMAAVLLAFGTSDLSLLDWILGLVAGTLAFLVVLLATGEIRRDELLRAVGVARGRVRAA
jgi:O-antigen/teichoic acid export membrane protein